VISNGSRSSAFWNLECADKDLVTLLGTFASTIRSQTAPPLAHRNIEGENLILMKTSASKLARSLGLVGLSISAALFMVEQLMRLDESLYRAAIEPLNTISRWLWPSSIMLMAVNRWNWAAVVTLILSIVANVALYCLVGFIIGLLLKSLSLSRGNAS
jgi:hypothetical protein